MQPEKVIVSEPGSQNEVKQAGKAKSVFHIDKSDYVGRFVMYIFIAIVALGFASMIGMGIFAFYFGV